MGINRWDPFQDILSLHEKMNRLFEDSIVKGLDTPHFSRGAWTPPIDIYETDTTFVLKAELSGIDKDDVDVRVQENILTVRGVRYPCNELKEDNIYRMERAYGKFARSFTLPNNVAADQINAHLSDGMLEIILPKS